MGTMKGEAIYYEELCALYEEHFDPKFFRTKLLDLFIGGYVDPFFADQGVHYPLLNLTPLDEQNRWLSGDVSAIREFAVYINGFRVRQAETILQMPHAFRRTGERYEFPRLSFEDAVKAAAFLDLPLSKVTDLFFVTSTMPWFQSVEEVPLHSLVDIYRYSIQHESNYLFEAVKCNLSDFGIPAVTSQMSVGLTLLHTQDFTEITVSTGELKSEISIEWEQLLLDVIAEQLGLTDSAFYIVSTPLLSASCAKCYRALFPHNRHDRTRAFIYNRLFSGRTELFTWLGNPCLTPSRNWITAIRLLLKNYFAQFRYEVYAQGAENHRWDDLYEVRINELLSTEDKTRGVQNRYAAWLLDVLSKVPSRDS